MRFRKIQRVLEYELNRKVSEEEIVHCERWVLERGFHDVEFSLGVRRFAAYEKFLNRKG